MGRKKTTEEFVADARKVHGDKYLYNNAVYKNAHTKVVITCHIHGDFEQTPSCHTNDKSGCFECFREALSDDTTSFICKAVKRHGNRYDYGKVVYTGSQGKLIITCPEHGDFEQRPNNHLNGARCPSCHSGGKLQKDLFINRSVLLHGGKYTYIKVVYKHSLVKVVITCPIHGDFAQTPHCHLGGRGCPKCTKNWSGDGVVYVMCTPESHNKIGIAKSGAEHQRLNQILRSQQQKSPTAFTDLKLVCAYTFNDGSFTEARRFEGKAHRHFKLRRKQFSDKFDGSCEFFTVPVSEICSYLEQQGGKLVTIKQ